MGVEVREESLPEGHAERIAATLGIEADSPILNGIADAFAIYLGLSTDNARTRGLDSRRLKRVREAAHELSAALDGCDDDTWSGLWLRVDRGDPVKREDLPKTIRDNRWLLHLSLDEIQHGLERLERAATPPRGTPKMELERYLLLRLIRYYQEATGEPATRRVSKLRKWGGLSTAHKEYGPFWDFLEASKKAYGLEDQSWVEPLRDILHEYGEKSSRE